MTIHFENEEIRLMLSYSEAVLLLANGSIHMPAALRPQLEAKLAHVRDFIHRGSLGHVDR